MERIQDLLWSQQTLLDSNIREADTTRLDLDKNLPLAWVSQRDILQGKGGVGFLDDASFVGSRKRHVGNDSINRMR